MHRQQDDTPSPRSQSLSWRFTQTYITDPVQALRVNLQRVTNAGRKRGTLDITLKNTSIRGGRETGQRKGGQNRYNLSFSLETHHSPAGQHIHRGFLSIRAGGGKPFQLVLEAQKVWPLESYTYVHTTHPSNWKLPHRLVCGKSTALLESPSQLPKDRLQDDGDVEGGRH